MFIYKLKAIQVYKSNTIIPLIINRHDNFIYIINYYIRM